MEILYNYKPYDKPRKGVFLIETKEYKLPGGWVRAQTEATVIGECDEVYVEYLKPTSHGEWVGNEVIQHEYILPLGFHKSRLVRWVDEPQLQLAI